MKSYVLAALLTLCATPAFAVPSCMFPRGPVIASAIDDPKMSEADKAEYYETRLRALGIDARQTTFWNGCVQTNVREDGLLSMRFYDPWSLEEVF